MEKFERPEKADCDQDGGSKSRNETVLPTKEEYEASVTKWADTRTGSVFSIIRPEAKRVLLAALLKGIIALHFNFCRAYKDNVIYNVLGNVNAVYWLILFLFLGSYLLVQWLNRLYAKYGVDKATEYFVVVSGIVYTVMALLVYVFYAFYSPGYVQELSHSGTLAIRRLGFVEILLSLVVNFVMVFYYLLNDLLSNALVNMVFMTYLTYNTNTFQLTRYFRLIGVANGISYLLAALVLKGVIFLQSCVFCPRNEKWLYISVYLTNSVTMALIVAIKRLLDAEFSLPLYQDDSRDKGRVKARSATAMGLCEMASLWWQSKLLYSISIFNILYNIGSTLFGTLEKYVYRAYAQYVETNSEASPFQGAVATTGTISMHFKAFELAAQFYILTFLMLSPIVSRLYSKFGFVFFGVTVAAIYTWCALSTAFMAAYNYPFTNDGKQVLFGLGFGNRQPSFYTEAIFIALNNFLIKLSKNAFIDLARESMYLLVNPTDRIIYKGIADGVIPRGIKMMNAFYGITCTVLGVRDVRYLVPLSMMVMLGVVLLTIRPMLYIRRLARISKKTGEYVE